jgi:DNA-binding transcriptional regulator of glucitol operon
MENILVGFMVVIAVGACVFSWWQDRGDDTDTEEKVQNKVKDKEV